MSGALPWVRGFGLGVHRYDFGCGPVYGHIGEVRGYTGIVVSTATGAARPPSPSPSTPTRPPSSRPPSRPSPRPSAGDRHQPSATTSAALMR
ncbi:hypothetical protein ACU635_14795 [[Actinomadura] parvosata]|uniref:hypothetical protein n=1 Tax=[Actinomadura] parvosata TaxID=1955412 RepID=UPI00406C7854